MLRFPTGGLNPNLIDTANIPDSGTGGQARFGAVPFGSNMLIAKV